MAWPLTPYEALVANVTVVHAATHNAVQAGVNGIIAATYSLKAVVVDGTGGGVVAGRAGTVKVNAADSGTVAPTTTVALGEFGKGLVPIGWASVDSAAGALVRGVNTFATTKVGAGQFTVTFNTLPTVDTVNTCAVVAVIGPGIGYALTSTVGGKIQAAVNIYNLPAGLAAGPVLSDINFRILLYAE